MKSYLEGIKKIFERYRSLGEKAFGQVSDEQLFWQSNEESNSIAIIVQHLAGNMLSRWTDLLNSDGEKPWRNRDAEFEKIINSRAELLDKWNEGWEYLFKGFNSLTENDLQKEVYIRGEAHSVTEALERQLAHCAYHIGQIVFIGKMVAGQKWESLSIPKGGSEAFNAEKFNK